MTSHEISPTIIPSDGWSFRHIFGPDLAVSRFKALFALFHTSSAFSLWPTRVSTSSSCSSGLGGIPMEFVHGGTPLSPDGSWWEIPSFEMDDDWGYPHDLGNLQVVSTLSHGHHLTGVPRGAPQLDVDALEPDPQDGLMWKRRNGLIGTAVSNHTMSIWQMGIQPMAKWC